jgi:hypothetical protein
MARGRIGQGSWSWGELSPEAYGRLDLDQYVHSARTLRNYRPIELGAATRRPGTRFIAEVKDPSRPPALETFVSAQGEAYLLELGELYARFYRHRARLESSPGVPLEVVTPYLDTETPLLKLAQSFDALYLASAYHPPQRLERYGDLIWKLRPTHTVTNLTYGPNAPPSYEYGARPLPGCSLTPAATSGSGIVVTASVAGMFRESDVGAVDNPGREILVIDGPSTGARARIVGFTDTQHVTVDILEPFATTGPVFESEWKLAGSPRATLTPGAGGTTVGEHITLTLNLNGWRTNDVPKFVRVNNGLVEINDFGGGPFDPQVVSGTVRVKLESMTAAPPGAWTLEEPAWSAANGYPAAVALGHGRLWFGGTFAQPVTVWGSASGDFLNFAAGVQDDDSIDVMLVGGQLNAIVWLAMTDDLYAGTRGEVYRIKSGSADVLSPTSIDAKPAVTYGSRPEAAPLSIGPALIFPTLAGLKLREMVFDVLQERQLAPDLLLLANHLTRPRKTRLGRTARGLRRIAYQREPIATIWGTHDSGEWSCCTYLREQNVVAWAPMVTQGQLLDVRVTPKQDSTGEDVWLLVRRVINGAAKVFVEWLDDEGLLYDRLHVDCGIVVDGIGRTLLTPGGDVQTAGAAVTFAALAAAFAPADAGRQLWEVGGPGQAQIDVVDNATLVHATILEPFASAASLGAGVWGIARRVVEGLGHLEGATVVVSGDGQPQPSQVVVGAQITAEAWAIAFEVGLGYASTLVTHRPPGQGQGQPHAQPDVLVRLHESIGLKVNGRRPDRDFEPGVLYSGDKHFSNLKETHGILTLEQDQPLPSTILWVQGLTEVNAG